MSSQGGFIQQHTSHRQCFYLSIYLCIYIYTYIYTYTHLLYYVHPVYLSFHISIYLSNNSIPMTPSNTKNRQTDMRVHKEVYEYLFTQFYKDFLCFQFYFSLKTASLKNICLHNYVKACLCFQFHFFLKTASIFIIYQPRIKTTQPFQIKLFGSRVTLQITTFIRLFIHHLSIYLTI